MVLQKGQQLCWLRRTAERLVRQLEMRFLGLYRYMLCGRGRDVGLNLQPKIDLGKETKDANSGGRFFTSLQLDNEPNLS